MSWHPFFHKTPAGKPNVLKPGWRSTLFELLVIFALSITLYNSYVDKNTWQKLALKNAESEVIDLSTAQDILNMSSKVKLACEASGLNTIQCPYEWWLIVNTLGAKESGRGHWKTVENPKGYEKIKCKLNQTSQAIGWGQILPNDKERQLLRAGKPVFRNGLDITSEFGNITYTCIHFKGKLKDAGVMTTASEKKVWEGVSRYNGGGPEARYYAVVAKKMYNTLQDKFRNK